MSLITYLIIGITIITSYLCFNNRALFDKLSLKPYRIVHDKEWYRLITHGFVHADSMHLLVNMFTFWSFGTVIERTFHSLGFGTGGFLLLYFGGMIAASLHDVVRYRNAAWYTSIGASGAVSAVLFTSILLNPWGKILLFAVLPIPGILFGLLYLFYCQYMARQAKDNINHNAHFYGAIYGLVLPVLLEPMLFQHFISHFVR